MNEPLRIIRDSNRVVTQKEAQKGGGNHRTKQIAEFFERYFDGVEICDVQFDAQVPRAKRWRKLLKLLVKHKFQIKYQKHILGWTGLRYQQYTDEIGRLKTNKCIFLEEECAYLGYYAAKDLSVPVVAFPHNLETTMPGYDIDYYTKKTFPDTFLNEIAHLAKARLVVCISREEQYILRNFGIRAIYLPYYPPIEYASFLNSIRNHRQQSAPSGELLIVAVTVNEATRLSVMPQLELLNSSGISGISVRMIGFGSERLKHLEERFKFLTVEGSVDTIRFSHLLKTTKAVLIHQELGPGALTKIPDYLVAGIPIIANDYASRSYFDYDGLYTYHSKEELALLISSDLPVPPPLNRKEHLERFVAEEICKLIA